MEAFDEFVANSTQYPCLQKWSSKLIQMGASWDSFRREGQDIVKDLVDSGIPILAARDIVDIASTELKRSTAPMAVFWDLENMPIPISMSGRDVTTRLKTILAPHGEMVQFRGYASIGLGHIPEEKRSDLHLAHCHLVDCPHVGRKDVADKMIIVDAMNFAYQHPEGATLCFITGDVDYAYLLASLQQNHRWKTIVISTKMQTMLQANCDMMMRWETDIIHQKPDTGTTIEDDFSEWQDDVEFLRDVVKREPLKSRVGSILRETNPARFPNRESVKKFFIAAIENGAVVETGTGPFKMLSLPGSHNHVFMEMSKQLPFSIEEVPERVVEMAIVMPYIIFVKWKFCPPGNIFPKRVFVQSTREWAVAMFHSRNGAQDAVQAVPWLRHGVLVDWNAVSNDTEACTSCQTISDKLIVTPIGTRLCEDCQVWTRLSVEARQATVAHVVKTLDDRARNDDVMIARGVLRNLLCLRYPDECLSKGVADLWIDESLRCGEVQSMNNGTNTKQTFLFLPATLGLSTAEIARELEKDYSTLEEERFVQDLLWEADAVVTRKEVIWKLENKFESMGNVFARRKVFNNGFKSGKFFLAKGRTTQVVGLTKEDADASLILMEGSVGRGTEVSEDEDTSDRERPESEMPTLELNDSTNSGNSSTSSNSGSSVPDQPVERVVDAAIERKFDVSTAEKKTKQASALWDSNGNPATRNLHVIGYGPETTTSMLTVAFGPYSKYLDVIVKHGYSFVNMAHRDDAIDARLRLNGTFMCGGRLVINFAKA